MSAGSLHELACSPTAAVDEAASRERHAPRIGLLNSEAQGGSCVDCGQHHMFCSCSRYNRNTRLSTDLDHSSPRSSLSPGSVRTVRTVRSLLAEQAANELRTFELAASEQIERIARNRQGTVVTRAASQRPRHVSFDDKVHELLALEANQIADVKLPEALDRAQPMSPMVKSMSLVFEDAEADVLIGRSPPTC